MKNLNKLDQDQNETKKKENNFMSFKFLLIRMEYRLFCRP